MSDDWKVGELALCVDVSPRPLDGKSPPLQLDRTYTVEAVAVPGEPCLHSFAEHLSLRIESLWYHATRFRKVLPDKLEGRKIEFVTLLKRSKVDA